MAGNRKAATDYLLTFMGKITKSRRNYDIYKSLFDRFTDEQFEDFVSKLEAGNELTIFAGNFKADDMLNYDDMIKLAKEYGLALMSKLIITDEDTGLEYTTPEEYFVGTGEIRRQREMQAKKFGAGKDDTRIDDLTGQVFGDSRGTGISIPEVRVLENIGMPYTAMELYDVKGGDLGALDAYKTDLMETGTASLIGSLRKGTGIKSLQTAGMFYLGRHIKNNLGER